MRCTSRTGTGWSRTEIRCRLVFLNAGQEVEVPVDAQTVQHFSVKFRESVQRMRELLVNAAANTPLDAAQFPMTEELIAVRPVRLPPGLRSGEGDVRLAPAASAAARRPERFRGLTGRRALSVRARCAGRRRPAAFIPNTLVTKATLPLTWVR